jgi:hypothetical protein
MKNWDILGDVKFIVYFMPILVERHVVEGSTFCFTMHGVGLGSCIIQCTHFTSQHLLIMGLGYQWNFNFARPLSLTICYK